MNEPSPDEVADARWLGEEHEVVKRTPDFLSLAGSVTVPTAKRNVAWDDVISQTRSTRAATRG